MLDSVITWPDATAVAHQHGLKPETLASRRRREGSRHARHLCVGRSVLYDPSDLNRYFSQWTDNRKAVA